MARKNEKELVFTYESSIKKSNELSMSKLNQGLTLNQMQLLAYAIYSTQQDGKTEFIKVDFERKFNLKRYLTKDAKEDAQRLLSLQFSIEDLENDYFEYWNVFQSIKYDKGEFRFKWTDDMVPHILQLQSNYVTTDLTMTSQFKSGFSWTLYEYLKALHGYWHKELSKEALMKLFGVAEVKSYQMNTGLFKKRALDVAVAELNQYTELEVWYTETKRGRAITGFILHWSTGEKVAGATEGQMNLLRMIHDSVMKDMMSYLALKEEKNLAEARTHILAMHEINIEVGKGLTAKKADIHIQKAKQHFRELEIISARDKNKKVVFYNWLEERE